MKPLGRVPLRNRTEKSRRRLQNDGGQSSRRRKLFVHQFMDRFKGLTSMLVVTAHFLMAPAPVGGREMPNGSTPPLSSPRDSEMDLAGNPWFGGVESICPSCQSAILVSFFITTAFLACTTTGARARTYLATGLWTLLITFAALVLALGLIQLDEAYLPLCLTLGVPLGCTGNRLRRWFRHNYYVLTTGAPFTPEDADDYNERKQAAQRPGLTGWFGAAAGTVYHVAALLVRPLGITIIMLLVVLLEAFVVPLVDTTAATANTVRDLKSLVKELVGPDFRVAPFNQW